MKTLEQISSMASAVHLHKIVPYQTKRVPTICGLILPLNVCGEMNIQMESCLIKSDANVDICFKQKQTKNNLKQKVKITFFVLLRRWITISRRNR